MTTATDPTATDPARDGAATRPTDPTSANARPTDTTSTDTTLADTTLADTTLADTTLADTTSTDTTWTDVCALDDLLPDRGAAALVGGRQVALFRLSDGPVLAIGNLDPNTEANVLSRGLVGSRGERAVVFSPLHKQAFDLVTGACLDVVGVSVPTYPVEVRGGRVLVGT